MIITYGTLPTAASSFNMQSMFSTIFKTASKRLQGPISGYKCRIAWGSDQGKMVEVFKFLLCHYQFKLCLVMPKYMHLSFQKSPDSCFENSSWTYYDETVHYVRTHPILTFLHSSNFPVYFIWLCWVCFFQFGSCQFYWNHVLPSLPHHHFFPVICIPIQQLPVWLGL